MKKTILLLSFYLFTFATVFAQGFTVSSTYSTLQGRSSEEIPPSVVLKNNSSLPMEIRWERVRSNVPNGWEVVVCDKQCYSTLIESRSIVLAPGESISDFRVSFRPNGVDGIGTVEINIYDVRNRKNSTTVMFSASAQNSSLLSVNNVTRTNASVYPNPATEHIMIQDDNAEVKYLEVYNVVGRKILDFSVNHSGGKYDVSSLPRGMYMVRMLDSNRAILRTQRISKYNP